MKALLPGLTVLVICSLALLLFSVPASSNEWSEEIQTLCLEAQDEEKLKDNENVSLLTEKFDKLLEALQESGDPKRKVYIFKLKKCRKLFDYMIELKESGKFEP
jgi:hypothetical protein